MAGSELTMDDLRRLLRQVAGADEGVELDDGTDDVEFGDLGYDSLALLEAAREVEREYGVTLADDLVAASGSPREFLTLINRTLVETETT